jgi:hypothetical protein
LRGATPDFSDVVPFPPPAQNRFISGNCPAGLCEGG